MINRLHDKARLGQGFLTGRSPVPAGSLIVPLASSLWPLRSLMLLKLDARERAGACMKPATGRRTPLLVPINPLSGPLSKIHAARLEKH